MSTADRLDHGSARPHRRVLPSPVRRPRSVVHTRCTSASCVANNVQLDAGYRQRHVSEGCTCRPVSVDGEVIKNIIRRGRIPLVSVQDEGRGQISLKVTAGTARSSYTALSHVWSDGLGNPTANALPQCQLELISNSLPQPSEEDSKGDGWLEGVRVDPVGPRAQNHGRFWTCGFMTRPQKPLMF